MADKMKRFSFPALATGPPSRRNWYQELLDDPECCGDTVRVKEAYETHREGYYAKQVQGFTDTVSNLVTANEALIKHLARQQRQADGSRADDDTDTQDTNCCVIWARPSEHVISLIQTLQKRLTALIGPNLHVILLQDLHLSIIELSHRHSVAHLRSVVDEIGTSRIQAMLDMLSKLDAKPSLVFPQLNIDKMGMALSFVPSSERKYTYHHLRADMHAAALESGISIDMCYTAPSAHVTLGRFVGNDFFEQEEQRKEFVRLVENINGELKAEAEDWVVGEKEALELQLGYLKFGREREKADMVGKI